jgi:hypothetical protein
MRAMLPDCSRMMPANSCRSASLSVCVASTSAKPCTLAIGVRSSCAAVLRNSLFILSTSVSCVTSRNTSVGAACAPEPPRTCSTLRPARSTSLSLVGWRLTGCSAVFTRSVAENGASGMQRASSHWASSWASRPSTSPGDALSMRRNAGLTWLTRPASSKATKPSGLSAKNVVSFSACARNCRCTP